MQLVDTDAKLENRDSQLEEINQDNIDTENTPKEVVKANVLAQDKDFSWPLPPSMVTWAPPATKCNAKKVRVEGATLALDLVKFIENEKLTLEGAFDVVASHYGELSLFDLKSAVARIDICRERKCIEVLHMMMDTRDTGLVLKEDWVRVLNSASLPQKAPDFPPADDDDTLSVDMGSDHLYNWGDMSLFRGDSGDGGLDLSNRTVVFENFATFRSSRSCAMGQKSYYEIKILDTLCRPQFGFVTADFESTQKYSSEGVGDFSNSWAVDGNRGKKWHVKKEIYGTRDMWQINDVLGLACDLDKRQILVSVNGSYKSPNGLVFQLDEDAVQHGLFAAFTASTGRIKYNLGDLPFEYGPPWSKDDDAVESENILQRTDEERSSRSLRIFAVAIHVQCAHTLNKQGMDFFDLSKKDFPWCDLESVVRGWQLDLSTKDVWELAAYLSSSTQNRIHKDRWETAIRKSSREVALLMKILTTVASALVWDVRTVYNAYPSKILQNAKNLLALESISKVDLVEMNDTWQFCLSDKEIDLWFRYLDSSHSGNITLQAWSRALDPFYAAISAMSHCLNFLLDEGKTKSSDLFIRFDKDKDEKLKPEELRESLKELLPDVAYPDAHVQIFHKHLTYFQQSNDDDCVFLCYWCTAFDLIKCDAMASAKGKSYDNIFLQAKQNLATDQFASLVMRPYEKYISVLEILISVDSHLNVPFEDLHWRLMCLYGQVTPNIVFLNAKPQAILEDVKLAVGGIRGKMATRGAQLLAVLLASHKLSIDEAFVAFCGTADAISFSRFREIMRRLAVDFGAASPRIESLFLSLASSQDGSKDLLIPKDSWCRVLREAAKSLNRHSQKILEKYINESESENQNIEQKKAEPDSKPEDSERQRLRDIFFDPGMSGPSSSAHSKQVDAPDLLKTNRLFINHNDLKRSLAKMGVPSLSLSRVRALSRISRRNWHS